MIWRMILSVTFFWCSAIQASFFPSLPMSGMTQPEYWGEEHAWWDGWATFKGQVIIPACTLDMENIWQAIDMGPVRDFVNNEKKLRLRLRNCELAEAGKRIYTASLVRMSFDGLQGDTSEEFLLIGQAEGINLQILDNHGYPTRVGKVMPPLFLNGNEEGLNYTLRLVRNGRPFKAGNYYAALRFKVDYE
ncbi:fimbrial protein [Escherichia coli]|uniref:fimbrial protein n=1 Tax=Escherichia TaxID=561 RepID=UPI000BE82A51|nr:MULTISPECIES: fimbrial protein [Escherichia]EFB2788038.1 fimbrial protein [Escherichia coli]EFN2600127.1 fimbrial protein [Escherichia coli]EHR8245447.1 fimbrial protein [Escherichia coli]EKK3234684.1 fimbrial protein [Escherichia coli]ELY8837671.1 fimbrial protein [Escherichia coli]